MVKNMLQKLGPPRPVGDLSLGERKTKAQGEFSESRNGFMTSIKPVVNYANSSGLGSSSSVDFDSSSSDQVDLCFKLGGLGSVDLDHAGRSSTSGSSVRIVGSPMDALRLNMVSPLRNLISLLKPPPPPESSLHGGSSGTQSSRSSSVSASEVENLCMGSLKHLTLGSVAEKVPLSIGAEISSRSVTNNLHETRQEGQSLVVVAFDGNVRDISHAGIVWAMDNILNRGDILAIVSVLGTVKGPLGYRVKIGDEKWLKANHKLVEDEISHKMKIWKGFPGLEYRCEEGGVKLAVIVKAASRPEVAICNEVAKLGANHVVLDKSLKNRRRDFYMQNLNCNVTRMRRSGGVDVIRPSLDMAMALNLVRKVESSGANPHPPSSVTPAVHAPALSYGDQIDEFEISLGGRKVIKAIPTQKPCPPAALSVASSTSSHRRSSSASGPSVRPSTTSISNDTERQDVDDDLFSIFHGSTREPDTDLFSFRGAASQTEVDIDLFSNTQPGSSGYESDDLFSIGNALARRAPSAPGAVDARQQSARRSVPDSIIKNSRLTAESTSSISEIANVSEPLQQATISKVTFVQGLGEAVEINVRNALRPGEGLLVGSSPSALFLMHNEQQRSSIATGTPGSYIAMEGRMAMKLAFLESDQRILAVDTLGRCRTIPVEKALTHLKPLVLIEAEAEEGRRVSVILHQSDSVCLSKSESGELVSVKSLKIGDNVLLRLRSAEPSHAIWS